MLVSRDCLEISVSEEHCSPLIVSFTGVGLGGVQKREFSKTLTETGGVALVYVIDKTRSWFSNPLIYGEIVSVLDQIIVKRHRDDVVFIGNSMGGVGALLFSARYPGSHAIAFGPQSTLCYKRVPLEVRWEGWRQENPGVDFLDVTEIGSSPAGKLVVFGEHCLLDSFHAWRLHQAGYSIQVVKGANHNAVSQIRKAIPLQDLVTHALSGGGLRNIASL